MKERINAILSSGAINNVIFNRTFQSDDCHVYSFRYEGVDSVGKYSINGYVQKYNNNKNAIINGESIHAFDCYIINK